MIICPGSIHFYVDMVNDLLGFKNSGFVPNILCEELFDRLWIIFQRMAPPQFLLSRIKTWQSRENGARDHSMRLYYVCLESPARSA